MNNQGYLKLPLCKVIHILWPIMIQQKLRYAALRLIPSLPAPCHEVPVVTPAIGNRS